MFTNWSTLFVYYYYYYYYYFPRSTTFSKVMLNRAGRLVVSNEDGV